MATEREQIQPEGDGRAVGGFGTVVVVLVVVLVLLVRGGGARKRTRMFAA
jgi:hypothetical protein